MLVRTLLLFESAMYSAVTPVLPHYAHALHASKPAVGLLTAAGVVAGLLAGRRSRWGRVAGTVLGAAAAAGIVDDISDGQLLAQYWNSAR